MTTQHTEGPWRYLEGRNGEFLISCESGGFAPLARIKGDKRSTLKDAKANARLIAAAPDLLGALSKIEAACAVIPESLEGYLEPLSDALADARAAIAKATGAA